VLKTTKRELAELLADAEYSVIHGITARTYWVNRYMALRKDELVRKVDRLTAPNA